MTTPRNILKNKGLYPRRKLGQSFLQDRNIIRRIVELAEINESDVVVEIGAGLGIMTGLVAEKARQVIALEIDPAMVDILKGSLGDLSSVEILHQDVLTYDFTEACRRHSHRPLNIIGNVPYNISSPILFHLLAHRSAIHSSTLMLQKEVADRICAAPGTKAYGIPSVLVSMYAKARQVLTVPAACFYPRPQVTSCVIRLEMRKKPLVDLASDDIFTSVVRVAFSKRRKTLLNNLKGTPLVGITQEQIISALERTGIDGGRRGETLSAEEFGLLSNALADSIRSAL